MTAGPGGGDARGALDAHLAGAVVAAATLAWWTATDRLDLPKAVLLTVGGLAVATAALARGRRMGAFEAVGAGAALLGCALTWTEMGARIEGWAPWLGAAGLLVAGRTASPRTLAAWLVATAVVLAGVCWAQALGAPLFNAGLSGFGGRRVMGTLGSPGFLGVCLAGLLPWVGRWEGGEGGRRLMLAGCAGALVLSGSRTGWLMAACGAWWWLRARDIPVLVAAALAAAGTDAWFHTALLPARAADLADAGGTAAGRLTIWRVYLETASTWLGLGHGPEGFVRLWPRLQDAFLASHPDLVGFRSDLRHAHADPVEILVDFGLAGGVLAAAMAVLALRGARRSAAASACLASLVAGGVFHPIAGFAPTLGLLAVSTGVCLGPPRRPVSVLPLVAAALLSLGPLTARTTSEIARSEATLLRAAGAPSGAEAARAVSLDPRNPRAHIERAFACQNAGDVACARAALRSAYADLPVDGVRQALEGLGR